jgi:hypothetical protein
MLQLFLWREKRGSSHPITGDDWLGHEQDRILQQNTNPLPTSFTVPSASIRITTMCSDGYRGSYKNDKKQQHNKSLNSSERQFRFTRSPPPKPLPCSERGGRRCLSPVDQKCCVKMNHIATTLKEIAYTPNRK